MSNYLLTGAAGFIGFRVSEFLLGDGHTVYGFDNLNDAYDIRLKEFRLSRLHKLPNLHFKKWDISERQNIEKMAEWQPEDVSGVINLAARVGGAHKFDGSQGLCRHQHDRYVEPAGTLSAEAY